MKFLPTILFSLFAVALLFIGCSGGSSSNPLSPVGLDPNAGPSAGTIYSTYGANVHQGIAGMNFSGASGMTPGFLVSLNSAVLLARSTAQTIETPPTTEPTGYSNGWYVLSDSSANGVTTEKFRWTPNPYRGGAAPTMFEQQIMHSITASNVTTSYIMSFANTKGSDGKYAGSWNDMFNVSYDLLPITPINYQSPTTWTNLNNARVNLQFTSPEGSYHAIGSAILQMTTSLPTMYYYEGNWVIPANVASGDSIGYLNVGGQLFASYFYTSLNPTSGTYNGNYRLAEGSDRALHAFTMQ